MSTINTTRAKDAHVRDEDSARMLDAMRAGKVGAIRPNIKVSLTRKQAAILRAFAYGADSVTPDDVRALLRYLLGEG